MKVWTHFPGQPVRKAVEAHPNIEKHFRERGWPLPFVWPILNQAEENEHQFWCGPWE